MRISVSNIAWNKDEDEDVFDLLQHHNVSGIEIAPTRLWPGWIGASPESITAARALYSGLGFAIPALQAILFDRPELKVFDKPMGQSALLDHIDHVADIGANLGARVLVFGSPQNRDPGKRTMARAHAEAVNFFLKAGERCLRHGVQLCLEPNPKVYNCRFMTRWKEVRSIVDDVSHAGIGIHLDTACITLEGDDVLAAIDGCEGRIAHFHVSEPELGDFSNPTIDHAAIGQKLRDINYKGWLSIEMRRSADPLTSIDEALVKVTQWYGPGERA